ncbi:hypothetical protein E2562_009244, partial [Oryza meyeriana var. granulata]
MGRRAHARGYPEDLLELTVRHGGAGLHISAVVAYEAIEQIGVGAGGELTVQ